MSSILRQLFHFFQEFKTRHVGHDQIGQNDVRRLLLEQRQRLFAAVRLEAGEAQRFPHRHAQLPYALLVIHDEQANSQIVVHSAFPMVFSTTEMNCCTRNGFSTQGAPVCCKVATVSSLAISPVMNTMRDASSGRFLATQA